MVGWKFIPIYRRSPGGGEVLHNTQEHRLAREAAQAQADVGDGDEQARSSHAANVDDDGVVSTQPKATQMMSDKLSPDKEQPSEVTRQDGARSA